MWIEKQPLPELGTESLTEAFTMPREFWAHTYNTHFDKSTKKEMFLDFTVFSLFVLQGPWEYSAFEVHAVEWEEPEVETEDSVGAVFIFKVNFIENRKIMPYQ
jgi:hypothetical protein